MRIRENGKEEHAHRFCSTWACICAGASVSLSWDAEIVFAVERAVEAGYGEELKHKKLYAKASYTYDHYKKAVLGDWQHIVHDHVVEYHRIQPGTSESKPDCLGFKIPFSNPSVCGLKTELILKAELVVLVSGRLPPDKSWAERDAEKYYQGKKIQNVDGVARSIEGDPKGAKTPSSSKFEPVRGDSSTTSAEYTLKEEPEHCSDWAVYLNEDVDRSEDPGPDGKLYRPKVSVPVPRDDSTDEVSGPRGGSLGPRVMLPVGGRQATRIADGSRPLGSVIGGVVKGEQGTL